MSGGNPISAVTDAFSSALGTDGSHGGLLGLGAQLDKSVRQVVPGGWATIGLAALAIAAPYAAPELFAAAPTSIGFDAAATGASAGMTAGGVGASGGILGGAATTAAGITGTEAAAGLGLGAAANAGLSPAVASMLSSAQTGALTGGAMGGINSAIRGTDPLTGILSGALMGGLTGASLADVSSLLAANGVPQSMIQPMSSALVGAAKSVAAGADPVTVLENTALSSGLGALSNSAKALISPDIGTTASNIATSAGTGALGSAIKGGDPTTGALSGAVGSGLNSLMAPVANILSSASSTSPYDPTVAQTPVDPASTVLGQQLSQEAQTIGSQASALEPTIAQQNAALASQATATNSAYDQAYKDQTALNNAISSAYTPAYNNVVSLQKTANDLYSQITPLQSAYDTNAAAYKADPTNTTALTAANDAATQLNNLIPQYNSAYDAFNTANTSLTDLYNTQIAPLQQTFQASNQSLQTQLGNYTAAQTALQNTTQQFSTYLSNLNQIASGNLVSGVNAPETSLGNANAVSQIPAAPESNPITDAASAVLNAIIPSANAAEPIPGDKGSVTVQNIGDNTTTAAPDNPVVDVSAPDSQGNVTKTYASGDAITLNANGDVVSSTTPDGVTTPITPADSSAPVDNTTPATSTGVSSSDVVANLAANQPASTPVDQPVTPPVQQPVSTPVDQPVTPPVQQPVSTPVDQPVTPPVQQPVSTDTGGLANTPVSQPTTSGGLPVPVNQVTNPDSSVTTTYSDGSQSTSSGTTAIGGLTAGTSTGTSTGTTTAGTGTSTGTTTAGTGTGAGTSTGTTTAGTGSTSTGTGSTSTGLGNLGMATTGTTQTLGGVALPTAKTIKGTQIASPLAQSYNVPIETYQQPTYNPQSLAEIQNAAEGGLIHMASGGSADFPAAQGLMHGRMTKHADLFGLDGAALAQAPHLAAGGNMAFEDRTLPEGHNPQFFSEGGLNSIHHRYVTGQGDGTSDSIPAMLANGEFVIPADVVSSLGNGSNDSGAKVLDEFLKTIREHKRKADAKHLPPDSKGALGYLLEAKRKASK